MLIRKTATVHKQKVKDWPKKAGDFHNLHMETIQRDVYWFLFIPIYRRDTILKTTL